MEEHTRLLKALSRTCGEKEGKERKEDAADEIEQLPLLV